jgi:hypothetical protein
MASPRPAMTNEQKILAALARIESWTIRSVESKLYNKM